MNFRRRWITICGRYYLTQIVALKTLFFKASLLSTAIPRWKYRFSSDHRSQATSGSVSTWMGDRLGIPSAVDYFFFLIISCYLLSSNKLINKRPLISFFLLNYLILQSVCYIMYVLYNLYSIKNLYSTSTKIYLLF